MGVSRYRKAVLSTVLLGGCAASNTEKMPAFEIRGLKNEVSDETETYSHTITYTHKGTVVAIGDTTLTHRPYIVMIEVKTISGGEPGKTRDDRESYALVVVRGGVGEFIIGGGSKAAYGAASQRKPLPIWEPEKIEATVVGVIPIRAVTRTVAKD